jgi:diguanylate cyclase (GGDEF)-like protein/PAS domain S-box-containing protein
VTVPGAAIRATPRLGAGVATRLLGAARRRPIVFLGGGILALALGTGAVTVIEVSDQTAREADVRLDRHAEAVAADVATLFANASRDVRLARRNPTYDSVLSDTWTAVDAAERATVDTSLTYVANRYGVDEICLIRSTGAEVGRWSGGTAAAPGNLSTNETLNPFFKPAMALSDDQVFVTQPYVSPDSGRWVYGFATPVVIASGVPSGVLHFEIPLARLAEVIADEPFGTEGGSFVVDRDGRIVSGPDGSPIRPDANVDVARAAAVGASLPTIADATTPGWRSAIAAAIGGQPSAGGGDDRPLVTVSDAGRDPIRVAAHAVPGTDLFVVSTSPFHALYADVDRTRLNLIATVGPLLLILVAVSVWYSRRLTRANAGLRVAGVATSQLASIVESADDAILRVEPDGRISTWNAAAESMYGRPPEAIVGSRLDELFVADRAGEAPRLLESVIVGNRVERLETVHRLHDDRPVDVWLTLSPIRDATGAAVAASVIARDITDRKRLEEELAHQALHDSLTGLPNRELFQDRLRQSLQPVRSRPEAIGHHALLFLDLDDFKLINDTLGHRTGDELLIAVAERLRDAIRASDTAARLGGDEFTILLENVPDEAEATAAAERILDTLRRPFALGDHQVVISASIGIAFGAAGQDRPDDVLRSADTALYEAKGRGKGRHETYHQAMNVRAWRRLEVENELRLAIARGELRLHYQPIIDLEADRVAGLEALIRWQHPTRGLVPPAEFIGLAEQTGLIVQLGAFVREHAIADLAALRRSHADSALTMSVNVSPRELAQPSLADSVAGLLARHGVPGDALRIEITEGAALEGEHSGATIRALRALGIRISIDDFGRGYASLGSFRELEIDGLKIDRAFVEGVGRGREDTAIVTAAIAFGRALDVDVTGEGIETAEQLQALRSLGCRYGQGFLFSKAVPLDEVRTLLTDFRRRDVA